MNSANESPTFGIGTWNRDGQEAYSCVHDALEVGYRHIDTAEMYGNEREVGKAIKDSGVKRDALFVTTKCGPDHYGKGQVMEAAKRSVEKLGGMPVDLYLLHWPSPGDQYDAHDYVAQLGEVLDKGFAKQIGVSNFTKKYMEIAFQVLGARAVATNQVECHVLMQNRPIVDYCKTKNIPVTAYSPLARGRLSTHAGLKAIGAKHEATPEQVALAFLLAEGHIVIPSSSKRARIESNWAAQKLKLSADEISLIRKMDEGKRLIDGAWCPKWDT